ncbi:MAG: hypothetical protein QG622_3005 [Actinomycetota bacterium]|nr:hypothetical protein [Actinomycetota bacterium]
MTGLPGLAELTIAGRSVAEYVDGSSLPAELAPRPFLHPVRTLAGTVVSDACPKDHRWHLGVGVAVQDVGGANLWGGRTYVREHGYVWRGDHGSIQHRGFSRQEPDAVTAELDWLGPGGERLLRETRSMRATVLPPDVETSAWQLDLTLTLSNPGAGDVRLGSPGSNGRRGAGYGGFFWRLPALDDAHVWTESGDGLEDVHGSTTWWLAVACLTGGRPATLLATQPGDRVPDPWFVRLREYPGFGVSLAPDAPVRVPSGGRIERRLRVLIIDGMPVPDVVWRRLSARRSQGDTRR